MIRQGFVFLSLYEYIEYQTLYFSFMNSRIIRQNYYVEILTSCRFRYINNRAVSLMLCRIYRYTQTEINFQSSKEHKNKLLTTSHSKISIQICSRRGWGGGVGGGGWGVSFYFFFFFFLAYAQQQEFYNRQVHHYYLENGFAQ